ncbi:MAG: 3-hydroxyacyl-ACP dehydratase FabZ [Proteobacteria bacterium]|nr:3-hydroxyacyl-ACP dehydratase FabZ [Pseudomonadota bacterium]
MTQPKYIEAIKKYLPHRYPFLMVDRVIEVIPGKHITAIKNVSINEPFFNGHFPHMPVMPGVLMIEAMAQASGILTYETLETVPEGELYFLAGIDNVRFKRLVVPGDQLQLHVELNKHRLDVWKFSGTATVEGEVACTAEFMNIKNKEGV